MFIYYEKAIKLLPLFFDIIYQRQNSCFQIVAFSKYINFNVAIMAKRIFKQSLNINFWWVSRDPVGKGKWKAETKES